METVLEQPALTNLKEIHWYGVPPTVITPRHGVSVADQLLLKHIRCRDKINQCKARIGPYVLRTTRNQ